MDSNYLQRLRFQLQRRYRRLNSCSPDFMHSSLIHFWKYLHAQPLTEGILLRLDNETAKYEDEIRAMSEEYQIADFDNEKDSLGFVYRTIEYCVNQPLGKSPEQWIGRIVSSDSSNDMLNGFREVFLEPLYEYLDESLDQQAAVLSLLVKYKRKVEWFERESLSVKASGGERSLAKHLYAYLFDQGLDFQIEPQSISGEADLIASELILDAKVFDGDRRGVTYLSSGVHQVHTYARDFNQEVGYLVVFKTCPHTIDFEFAKSGQFAPHVVVGGKTIYILVIDIHLYEVSASKRGPLKTYSVTLESIVSAVKEEAPDLSVGV